MIDEIAEDCVNNLLMCGDEEISVDEIYDEAHKTVEEIISDIAMEVEDRLKAKGIEITY